MADEFVASIDGGARKKEAAPQFPGSVFTRPQRAPRREGRTREDIVHAAVHIADAEGIDAVSMRRVAAELGTSAMSLYWYIENKDELIELMFDSLMGKRYIHEPATEDWRENCRSLARLELALFRQHSWITHQLAHRPALGPNWYRHIDQTFAALDMLDREVLRTTLMLIDSYVLGFASREIAVRDVVKRSGMSEDELSAVAMPHREAALESGEYPYVAHAFSHHFKMTLPPDDEDFARGLECLLDGVALLVERAPWGHRD